MFFFRFLNVLEIFFGKEKKEKYFDLSFDLNK